MSTSKEKREADFANLIIGFGCDPELFLYDTVKQRFIHGHGIIPGTKREPFVFDNGGSCQLDGVACEIGIPPAFSTAEWIDNLQSTLFQVKKLLPKGVVLKAQPSVWFDKEYFDKEVPDVCKELGCDPDFNAYNNGAPNPRPNGMIEKDGKILRTGAGHIHISWGDNFDITSDQHRWDCMCLTRTLDTVFDRVVRSWDTDTVREQMYGAKGSYRPKRYGMEYRVPSNAWVANKQSASVAFAMAKTAMYLTYVYNGDLSVRAVYDSYTNKYIELSKSKTMPEYMYIQGEYLYSKLNRYGGGALF